MSVLDKFLNVMRLNDTNDYDDDFFDDDDYIEEPRRKKSRTMDDEEMKERPKPSKVMPIRQTRKVGDGMEVCVIKPTTVEDSREITETLLSNRTVVLNLEGLDVEIAQRIIDFTSGSCFAINGNLQKISNYIFIITPSSVDISGDFHEIINGALDVPHLHNGL